MVPKIQIVIYRTVFYRTGIRKFIYIVTLDEYTPHQYWSANFTYIMSQREGGELIQVTEG